MERKLLAQAKDIHKYDVIPQHWFVQEPMIDYAGAYWDAARELASNHEKGGTWALPIVFLTRHAIELFVKQLLMVPRRDGAKVSLQCVLERSHNLQKQVDDLRKIADIYKLHLSQKLLGLLTDFENDDPMGMWSRFPMDKKGKETRLLDQDSSFELQRFMDRCEWTINELERLRDEIETEDYRDAVPEAFEHGFEAE